MNKYSLIFYVSLPKLSTWKTAIFIKALFQYQKPLRVVALSDRAYEICRHNDYVKLIEISESLVEYGKAKLTPNTIQTYFNREGTLPFIARHQNQIIGYIIGIPPEILSHEPWARLDIYFGHKNYLYLRICNEKEYKANGYAKMLKSISKLDKKAGAYIFYDRACKARYFKSF